jgi:hypothetical protein
MAIPIQELNLPARSFNSLKSEGIDTVGELVARTENDLLSIRNLGEKSIGEIEQRLSDLGLALAEPVPGTAEADGAAEPAGAEHGAAASNGSTPTAAWDGNSQRPAGTPAAAWRDDQDASARSAGPDDDALNLLDVAAGPILKRALPALAAVAALIWLATRLRGRGRRAAGDLRDMA